MNYIIDNLFLSKTRANEQTLKERLKAEIYMKKQLIEVENVKSNFTAIGLEEINKEEESVYNADEELNNDN